MYADPSLIRDVIINVRLNDAEAELLDAVVKYTGQQKSSLMRELFLEQARLVLMGQGDIGVAGQQIESAQPTLNFGR
jgi:uncharacterized protein (DUF1778 family)